MFPRIEKWFSGFSQFDVTYLTGACFLFLTLASSESSYVQFFSATLGIAVGSYFNQFFQLDDSERRAVYKFCFDIPIAIIGAFFIFTLIQKASISNIKTKLITQSSILGLWLSFVSIYLTSFFSLKAKKEKQVKL